MAKKATNKKDALPMEEMLWKREVSASTIGIILCDDTDDDIARFSVLHDNDHLFASKYMLYMPTQEQLRNEIERQKAIYYLQHKDLQDEIEL